MTDLFENRDLLEAYRRAEPDALDRIYREYVAVVASFLRQGFNFSSKGRELRFTGYTRPEDLQDSLQETFMLAFGTGARHGYNGLTPFKNYLLGIARNVVLERFRKDVSRLECFHPVETDQKEIVKSINGAVMNKISLATIMRSPEEEAATNEIRKLVMAFVNGLSQEQKMVVRLHFMERMSQEATAETLSINRNRVRKQIMAIRRKLLKKLRKEGLDDAFPLLLGKLEVKP